MTPRILAVALAAGACTLALAPAAIAATPGDGTVDLVAPDPGGAAFENYDRVSASASTSSNADWPVTMVFVGNATVAKVKQGLAAWFPFTGSTMYEGWGQAGALVWDPDGGLKNRICSLFGVATHVRVYAASGVAFTGPAWGRYVVATTHQDRGECGFSPRFGWSEDAEATVASYARRRWGAAAVQEDAVQLGNAEGAGGVRQEGDHYWQSDGRATIVAVP